MKKLLPLFLISSSLLASDVSFDKFMEEEVISLQQELELVKNGIQSGLDIQQYYYVMGKQVELERIRLNWNHFKESN